MRSWRDGTSDVKAEWKGSEESSIYDSSRYKRTNSAEIALQRTGRVNVSRSWS
jgi:hypothetical protein